MTEPEVIEIGMPAAPKEINIDTPTVNFGGGIELLMNEKKKEGTKSPTSDINANDLTKLENELNDNPAASLNSNASKAAHTEKEKLDSKHTNTIRRLCLTNVKVLYIMFNRLLC